MFGGHGLFAPNGGMFACIVDEDRITLKLADPPRRAELIGQGGEPWTYNGKVAMKDWIVIPDALYDDTEALTEWASRAHRLAPPKAAKKKPTRASPKPVIAAAGRPQKNAGSAKKKAGKSR